MKVSFLISILMLSAMLGCSSPALSVIDPMTEGMHEPEALHTASPRLSWKIQSGKNEVMQESYRILAATSEDLLYEGKANLWDSGNVESGISVLIPYEGKEIESSSKVWWKVKVRTNIGTAESSPTWFRTGMLNSAEIKASWIGKEFEDDVLEIKTRLAGRMLRKEFNAGQDIQEAVLHISGQGLYKASINGHEVGSCDHLKPTPSDYSKTVYINTYDITEFIRKGKNTIGVELGSGRYTAPRNRLTPRKSDGIDQFRHFGTPCMIAQIEMTYEDGTTETVISDGSWKITDKGPIRMNNLFDGEHYDARFELPGWDKNGFDDSAWQHAEVSEGPDGELLAQPNPPIRKMETLNPVSIIKKGDSYILDMGQNMVGWLQIHIKGQHAGDTLRMRFAEMLNPDTTLYTANLRTVEQTDIYVAKDRKPFTWKPSFTYHGFRYVEIKGLRKRPYARNLEGHVLYDDMKTTGSFGCSDEMMNKIYSNAYWGIRGNYNGMPTDCPQRDERLGWSGDRTTGAYGEGYVFDNRQLYSKWIKDFADSQNESGALSDVVPNYWRLYSDNLTWTGAFITTADMVLQQFGDDRPVKEHYDAMKKWMVYMKNRYGKDGIITKDRYGDWCMPPESLEIIHSKDPSRKTAAGVLSTAYYHYLAKKMVRFATIAGHPEDAGYWSTEAEESKEAFNREYFNEEAGNYANNTVTANLLPLWFDMVPEEREADVLDAIIRKTEGEFNGHVSTGVVGIQSLMRTLTVFGKGELAYRIASADSYPSWGYMVKNGATTIWELWNGNTAAPDMNSANHVMILGDLLIWEYGYLGGIRALEPGFKKISLKPYPADGLEHVDCSYDSPYGMIRSSWKRRGEKFIWEFTIPANTTAAVSLPTSEGYEEYQYKSGTYRLESIL